MTTFRETVEYAVGVVCGMVVIAWSDEPSLGVGAVALLVLVLVKLVTQFVIRRAAERWNIPVPGLTRDTPKPKEG